MQVQIFVQMDPQIFFLILHYWTCGRYFFPLNPNQLFIHATLPLPPGPRHSNFPFVALNASTRARKKEREARARTEFGTRTRGETRYRGSPRFRRRIEELSEWGRERQGRQKVELSSNSEFARETRKLWMIDWTSAYCLSTLNTKKNGGDYCTHGIQNLWSTASVTINGI